ncbi:MAG: hypothetical protein NVS1B10_06470 [Candidatus Saccharimonadales bacterium]
MPYVMNALNTQVSVQATGKWFTFKPNEIKTFHNANIASFISQNKGEEGLVEIADPIMELDPNNPERLEYIRARREEGIQKRVQKLEFIKQNLLGSLRYDVELKGIKTDPLTFATKGELAAIKELNVLTNEQAKNITNVADEVRKALGILDGTGSSPHIGATDTGRSYPPQPTKTGK